MRILILTNYANGLYLFRRELLQAFLSDGHEVFVSLPPDENVEKLTAISAGGASPQIIETPFERRGMNPLRDLKLFAAYRRLLREQRPDVVLTYTIKPNIYGGLACRLAHVRCLANVTGLGTAIEHGGILSSILLTMYRVSLKRAAKVFFQNRGNMDFLRRHGIGRDNGDLLPGSGVNLTEHPYCAYPSEDEGITFLAVLRIMRDKGIGEYFAAAERLKKVHPSLSFVLAGEYEEEERSVWEPEIRRLSEAGILTYVGHIDHVHDLMAKCHAIIHPSYHEGLSNVLLEAAACGRPVLASNVSGCTATFVEGVSGLRFEAGDVPSLTDAAERFLSLSLKEHVEMGKAGREFVEAHFDRQIVIRKYREALK
ncbi:MAG: glycosyltransferase family 4 protein [Lachnospiraceae bacterium]|nr:glycosyltransferase family 4 protein [Lachnospiraceae bacterium]